MRTAQIALHWVRFPTKQHNRPTWLLRYWPTSAVGREDLVRPGLLWSGWAIKPANRITKLSKSC